MPWAARGTSKGKFLMLSSTGQTVEYTGASMYRVEGDTTAEIWDTWNTFGIMRQLNPERVGGHHSH